MTFDDRLDAGRRLGRALEHHRGFETVVLGLPRGGVPVAAEVARVLGAPLDVLVVRKLGVPGQNEVAMGAIGEDGSGVVNWGLVRDVGLTRDQLAAVEARERPVGSHVDRAHSCRREDLRPWVPTAGAFRVNAWDSSSTRLG